jgi:hypothetical protein
MAILPSVLATASAMMTYTLKCSACSGYPHTLRVALLLLAIAASTAAQMSRADVFAPADVRGVSWSDPRDNYNLGQIVPAGLKLGDTPEHAAQVAITVARRALGVGANVVRVGINPPTIADRTWWPTYERAVQALAANGVRVILCAWEQSPDVHGNGRSAHNGRFGVGSVESYATMWRAVHEAFRHEPNVLGYELLNEPFGYRGQRDEYVHDMRSLMSAMGDLRDKRILVAGLGYSDDVRALRDQFPEQHVWFAYHVYPNWFGGEAGDAAFPRERYEEEITRQLEGVESRTVITEFGCWGGDGYDYAKPAIEQGDLNAHRHVAYLHGVADACSRLKLGSIYWFADARESRRSPSYDLFADDGRVHDSDRLAEIRRAWRLSGSPEGHPAAR